MASIDIHVHSIFRFDATGRFDGMHDWVPHDLPLVHIGFSTDSDDPTVSFARSVHNDDQWNALVRGLRAKHAPPSDETSFEGWREQIVRAAEDTGLTIDQAAVTGGPAYVADPSAIPVEAPAGTTLVTAHNAHVLERFHPDWLADVAHQQPIAVALLGEHAVAVCSSARKPAPRQGIDIGYQAGVETSPNVRRRGYATRAVKAWCRAVQASGFKPVYSTSWDNLASQRVPRGCGLRHIRSSIRVG